MRKKGKILRACLSAVLVCFIFSGCKSPPPVIPEDLSQPEIFQRAQEQADNNRWDNALSYYEAFLERFPDDLPNVLAARYEIAFIQYKKEQYVESKKLFSELLETYKTFDNPLAVPQWPKVLAEKLVKKIDEKIIVFPPQ
jgi:outer membrane protein assembly factor BamD (BamD/ComL family)